MPNIYLVSVTTLEKKSRKIFQQQRIFLKKHLIKVMPLHNTILVFYMSKEEATQSLATAVELYKKAAKQGLKEAFNVLSDISRTGNQQAIKTLANLHEKGEGTPKNYQKAIEYYKMLAEKGKHLCYFKIGQLYEEGGYGIRKNLAIAKANYQLALNHGFQPAQEALTRLSTFR